MAKNLTDLKEKLAKDQQPMSVVGKEIQKVVFLFPGQGSQYFGMAKGLHSTSSTFRTEFERVDDGFRAHFGISLATVLWVHNKTQLESTLYCQPAIFCVQVAVARFWAQLGLFPDVVLGHSVGEFAAAVSAGVVSFEDGLKMVIGRSRLISQLPVGAMLAISTDAPTLTTMLEKFKKLAPELWIDVAAVNSHEDFVVSGRPEAITTLALICVNNGIKKTALRSSNAFHSRDMDDILDPYAQIVSQVSINQPRCTYISGATGKIEKEFSLSYWTGHVRNSVSFSSAMETLGSTGCNILVEVGTHPVLLGLIAGNPSGNLGDAVLCPTLRRSVEDRECVLGTLEKLYRNGVDINWNSWYDGPCHKIQLPNYPFQRQRFWIADQDVANVSPRTSSSSTSGEILHPFLGRLVSCNLTENRFRQTINLDHPQMSFLSAHKIGGRVIFPAASFLEMILGAGKILFPEELFTVHDLVLENALPISSTVTVETHLRLLPAKNSFLLKVEIFQVSGQRFQRCVTAALIPNTSEQVRTLEPVKTDALTEEFPASVHAEFFNLGFTFGSEFQSIVGFWYLRSTGEVVTEVKLPRDSSDYVCHPIVSDAMIQTGVYVILRFAGLQKLALPVKWSKFTWYQKPTSERLFLKSSWGEVGKISLYNESGELLALLEGLDFHHIPADSFIQILDNKKPIQAELYTEMWKKEEISKVGASTKNSGTWLVVTTNDSEISELILKPDEVGRNLVFAQLLPPNFTKVLFPPSSTEFLRTNRVRGTVTLSSDDATGFEKLITSITDLETILYVELRKEPKDAESLAPAQEGIQGMLTFAQIVIKLKLGNTVTIIGVTRSVFAVDGFSGSSNPSTATVQGFFKAFRTEHPELRIYSLDVDGSLESEKSLISLIQNWDPAEPVKALRNGQVYVPRLSRMNIPEVTSGRVFRDDATYLVTGGTKGIGLQVVQWMARKGAKSLVVTSRNAPDAATAGVLETCRAAHGCQIEFMSADVGDLTECKILLTTITAKTKLKLGGIFHSAGVLDDALIPHQSVAKFAKSYQAKVNGAWNLHLLTKHDRNMDFFVLFSSIVSLIGNVGQSNYISANQFLDTLVQFRKSLGLPGVTINWGPWSEIGMANDSRLGTKGALGLTPISPPLGIEALERIMQIQTRQVAVVGPETNFAQMREILSLGNYLADVIPHEEPKESGNSEFDLLQHEILKGGPLLAEKVTAYVESLIRNTLRLSPDEVLEPDQPFTEHGMDSLMAVEVRGHLMNLFKGRNPAVGVSMSLVQDKNTLKTLSAFVVNNLEQRETGVTSVNFDLRELVHGDSQLPEDVTTANWVTPAKLPIQWRHILVTGANGFVGAHFVAFLNEKGLRTSCLIRGVKGREEGRDKLESALRKFELWDNMDMSLVDIVVGDITSATFGWTEKKYKELSRDVDAVVHCAALVNHIDEYADGGQGSLRSINVLGLVNILRFASANKTKPVLYPGTLTAATQVDEKSQLLDEWPLDGMVDPVETFKAGYTLSKFVAENLLRQASTRGIPCLMLRFPTLFGNSKTGHFPTKFNQFSRLLLSCIRIRQMPDWGRKELPVMPVDEAVRIGLTIFLKADAQLGVYNLTFSGMPTGEDFREITREMLGVEMNRLPFFQWTQMAIQGEESLLRPFRDLYEEKSQEMPKVTRWNILYTKLLAAKLGVTSRKLLTEIGDVDQVISPGKVILQRHLEYARKSGLLKLAQ